MRFSMKGIVVLTMDHTPGETKSRHVSTDFNIEVSGALDEKAYIENGIPNENGAHCLTNLFVQGLIGNIHLMDQKGYRDTASHLQYVISELERGVFMVTDVKKSEFGKEAKDEQ